MNQEKLIELTISNKECRAFHSQVAQVVKNMPATVGNTRDVGSIPGSRKPSEVGNGNPCNTLTWKIPWTEPGRLQSMGSQRVRHD